MLVYIATVIAILLVGVLGVAFVYSGGVLLNICSLRMRAQGNNRVYFARRKTGRYISYKLRLNILLWVNLAMGLGLKLLRQNKSNRLPGFNSTGAVQNSNPKLNRFYARAFVQAVTPKKWEWLINFLAAKSFNTPVGFGKRFYSFTPGGSNYKINFFKNITPLSIKLN